LTEKEPARGRAQRLAIRSETFLAVPRLGPGAVVAEPGSSLKAARIIGLIARARERLRCFAKHRARLL
jgi:hypothetical protein